MGLPINSFAIKIVPFTQKNFSDGLLYTSQDNSIKFLVQEKNILSSDYKSQKTELFKAPLEQLSFDLQVGINKNKFVVAISSIGIAIEKKNKESQIYLGDVSGKTLTDLGVGTNPQFHYQDSWISYYKNKTKQLHLKFIPLLQEKKSDIQLRNDDPFYTPSRVIINNETLVYSDLNKEKEEAIIHYNLINNSFDILFKSENALTRSDLCQINGKIYMSAYDKEFRIFVIDPLATKVSEKVILLFKQDGIFNKNIVCDPTSNKIFFLKGQNQKNQSSIFSFMPTTKDIVEHSLDFVASQILLMDNKIYLTSGSKTYVVAP